MKYTSASANKRIKKLNEEKALYVNLELNAAFYVAAADEAPVIPDFDYAANAAKIEAIDLETVRLKHAINVNNALAVIDVNGESMSVDQILVRMAQLNTRLFQLDDMRKALPKQRVDTTLVRGAKPEYKYTNFDIEQVKADYESISEHIMQMQLALDKYNQTAEFEV